MKQKKGKVTFLGLAKKAANIADSKKGDDIVIFNVKKLTTIADYFVLVSAGSKIQMNAIIENIENVFKNLGYKSFHKDGVSSMLWTVIDYGGLVIHVMTPYARDLYGIDRLWGEARKISWNK